MQVVHPTRTSPAELAAGSAFHRPTSLRELFGILEATPTQDIRIVAGNTGAGVYKNWPVQPILIELKHLPQLRQLSATKV